MAKGIGVNVDCLIVRIVGYQEEFLMGSLSKKWLGDFPEAWGLAGRDILPEELAEDAVKRTIRSDIGCDVVDCHYIATNVNYEAGNHYVGLGYKVRIEGEPQLKTPED